jgi:S1-C subfamily serine protease
MEGLKHMRIKQEGERTVRLLAVGLIILLGGYLAGSKWGTRVPASVSALHLVKGHDEPLTGEEAANVQIYKQASPAVANIVTRTVEYDFFFNTVPVEGAGSGFVIDTDGHILTNYHVVQGAQTIEVTLGDQSRFKATLLGADQRNDVALLKITPGAKKLVPLALADSRGLQVGQRVLAIGNPFGFQSTLTTGVVSALGRTVQTGDNTFIDLAIQTDAAINRGNSGGPLLNSHGEVIGVNSAIYTPTGATSGIGFAIPIDTARRVAEELITSGHVRNATLGVSEARPLWPGLAEALQLPVSRGLLIERVVAGGPADQAGIRGGTRLVQVGLQRLRLGGDILTAIDGHEVSADIDVSLVLNRKVGGDRVTLTVYRDGRKIEIPAILGEE